MHTSLTASLVGLLLSLSVPLFASADQSSCISFVSSDALNSLKAGIRQEKSKAWTLSRARDLSVEDRRAFGSWLVGKRLPAPAQDAVVRAHEVGKERGYFRYTRADLALKVRTLAPHFSRMERRWLMEYGAVGGMDIENVIELPRYSTRVTLTDERELQAYAEVMLDALSQRRDFRSSINVANDYIDDLVKGGIDRDDARMIVRSILFDKPIGSDKMGLFERMVSESGGGYISEDVQSEVVEEVIENGTDGFVARHEYEKFLEAFGIKPFVADLLLDTLYPQSTGYDREVDSLLEVMKKIDNIYLARLSNEQSAAIAQLLKRRGSGVLSPSEGRYGQALLEFVDFSTRDASEIISFLSRQINEQELKDEEFDDDELEFLSEFMSVSIEVLQDAMDEGL